MLNALRLTLHVLLMLLFSVSVTAQTTITVYHRNELREIEWMEQIKKEFEALNPDIQVDLIQGVGGGGAGYAERLAILWASGNPPDVFYGSTDKAGYILNGWAKDITALIERDRAEMDIDDFFAGVFEAATRQGKIYGVPAIAMGQAIFYNKDLFDQAGLSYPTVDWNSSEWTWDDLSLAAEKLSRFNEEGRLIQAGLNSIEEKDISWMFGGDWFPAEAYETGIAPHSILLSDENLNAYEAMRRLYVEKRVVAGGVHSDVDSSTGFREGIVGMEWSGWWMIREYLATKSQGGMNFEWGIAPMPLVQNRNNTVWTDPWFISSTTRHTEEAWRFVKYVTSRDGLARFVDHVAFPPSRASVLDLYVDTVTQISGMDYAEAAAGLSGALMWGRPAMDETVGGASIWQGIVSEELDAVRSGERSVLASLEEAQQRVDAVLKDLASQWAR